ncbi:MAG: YCF48-related protein [Anaerolineae bacterium]|nr:YCF48-related protein [Anaerolineae bacterium]
MKTRLLLTAAGALAFSLLLPILSASALLGNRPRADNPALTDGYWITQRLSTPDHRFFFADGDTGWAMGMPSTGSWGPPGSELYRTQDGGVTWREVYDNGIIAAPRNLERVFFVSPVEGWISGTYARADICWGAFIAHTADGGDTWHEQYTSPCRLSGRYLGDMWFLDSQHGWVGDLRTTDGGQTWQELNPNHPIWTIVRFVNPNTGFALGPSAGPPYPPPPALLRTDDGGSTWTVLSLLPAGANAVWARPDGARLWAVGAGGAIALSLDGGLSWTPVPSPTAADLHHVRFADGQRGWAAGRGGVLLRTTDGGWRWYAVDIGTTADVTALFVTAADQVWVFADGLRRSFDGGVTWQRLPYVAGDVRGLAMGTEATGWAITDRSLLKTRNAGGVWVPQATLTDAVAVEAVDAQHAWVLTTAGLRRTVDGVTWQTIPLPGVRAALGLDFVDSARGWLLAQTERVNPVCEAYDEQVYRTQDGGLTWTPLFSDDQPPRCGALLQQVVFVNTSDGWAAGHRGLLRTTDGGLTWQRINTDDYVKYTDFADPLRGWRIQAVSYGTPYYAVHEDRLQRTADGGVTWETVRTVNTWYGPGYRRVEFGTPAEGWVAGDEGRVLYTTDGGETWSEASFSDYNLFALAALPSGRAWFGGQNGFIGRYSAAQPAGCWATPTPRPPSTVTPPASAAVSRRIAHCMDDAYVRLDSADLLFDVKFVRSGARPDGAVSYQAGLVFRNVAIPRGAAITSARLRLTPWGYQSGTPVRVELRGELRPNTGEFSPFNWWPQDRPRTRARVPWTLTTTVTGPAESPDIAAVVQEIVDQPGWRPGNSLTIFLDPAAGGAHYVDWMAFDYQFTPALAAELQVSYTTSTGPTPTPTPTASPTPTPTATATPAAERRYLPLILRSVSHGQPSQGHLPLVMRE